MITSVVAKRSGESRPASLLQEPGRRTAEVRNRNGSPGNVLTRQAPALLASVMSVGWEQSVILSSEEKSRSGGKILQSLGIQLAHTHMQALSLCSACMQRCRLCIHSSP